MRHVTVNIYTFDELAPAVQARVLDKQRDWNIEGFDWWDFTYDDWQSKLNEFGYIDAEIAFSGFASQGDGASFTCQLDFDKLLPRIMSGADREFIQKYTSYISGQIERVAHHYSHWNTVACSYLSYEASDALDDLRNEAEADESDPVFSMSFQYGGKFETASVTQKQMSYNLTVHKLDELMNQLRDAITADARDLMRQIYHALETEYDYLISDEAVKESFEANEIKFLVTGEIFLA